MGERRDPHVAIMDAARDGRGLRLTADEVWALAQDSAIATRAEFVRSGGTEPPGLTFTPSPTPGAQQHD